MLRGAGARASASTTTNSAQEERLRAILERRLGTRIDLNCEVDSAVIGGARISTRNYVMDRTVRSAVAELRTRLAG